MTIQVEDNRLLSWRSGIWMPRTGFAYASIRPASCGIMRLDYVESGIRDLLVAANIAQLHRCSTHLDNPFRSAVRGENPGRRSRYLTSPKGKTPPARW